VIEPLGIPQGRLKRFGKLLSLPMQVGGDIALARVKKWFGGDSSPTVNAATRVLETLGEMKGAALKLGQTLSLASGQLPPEVRNIAARLFSQVPALEFRDIEPVLVRELGLPLSDVFAEFEREPFAAASLGQVHKAQLRDGTVVAVKVQYPGVEKSVHADLKNARAIFKMLGLGSRILETREYHAELKDILLLELDYLHETAALEKFRAFVSDWPELEIPRVYRSFCTSRVLVLEYFEGMTLHRYFEDVDNKPSEARFRIATQLTQAIFGPFIRYGVVFADTHPGNFIVRPSGKLGLLDFGCVKYFSQDFWLAYKTIIDKAIRGKQIDLELLQCAGFKINLEFYEAQRILNDITKIVYRPLRGYFDFGAQSPGHELKEYFLQNTSAMLDLRPPAESISLYRAVVGGLHSLRSLKAAGHFGDIFQELLRAC
jgi:predicted unusual protein kinase regulating ubiquinone biosynthesis (AarF/ABC1/UbiB family)